jgi:hypothetical protein
MSNKAMRMLKHMRRQLRMQETRDASAQSAARSIGVKPEAIEFDGLVDELLQAGYIQSYRSTSLTAHGLYRLTDRGIAAAEEG